MNELVPALKFPTNLIVIDDNPDFLNNFGLILESEHHLKTFTSPKDAIPYIEDQQTLWLNLIKNYLSVHVDNPETSYSTAKLNLSKIHDLLYNPERFALPAVIITDFAMPDMNGIEFSEQLKNRLLKIILLTGEAGYDLAVAGFNKGLIEQFVLKSKVNFFEEVKQYVLELENKLFQEISKGLIDAINTSASLKDSIFYDPIFIKFFEDLIKQHNIVEYYLLDPSGSYLLMDVEGKIFWLIMKNEEDMKLLYEVALNESTDEAFINSFKDKKKLVFFADQEDQLVQPDTWRPENTTLLAGRNNYYYALVAGTDDYYKLDEKKILTYSSFLNINGN